MERKRIALASSLQLEGSREGDSRGGLDTVDIQKSFRNKKFESKPYWSGKEKNKTRVKSLNTFKISFAFCGVFEAKMECFSRFF